jgi:hypothetical protein
VTLRTPSAVIAVRGGVFLLEQLASGQATVIFLFGNAVTVTGLNGVTQTLSRPGFAMTVAGPGASPSEPFRAPTPRLADVLAQLDGRAGGTGGALRVPTNTIIANSGIDRIISANLAASNAAAAAAHPTPQPVTVNPANLQTSYQVNTVQAQGNATLRSANQRPVTSGPGTSVPTSSVFITKDGNIQPVPVLSTTMQNGVLAVVIPSGSANIPLPPGIASYQNASSSFGPLSGSSFLSPDGQAFYTSATTPNFPGYTGFVVGGVPTATLPTSGVGTYAGNVAGSVFNNGVNSQATGTFQTTYDFGSNSGNFAVNNFDNRNFSGAIRGATGSLYSGALSGANLAGNVNGQFFGTLAANTAGRFQVNSTSGLPYNAFGVFGGVAH